MMAGQRRASEHQNGSPFSAGRLIFSCPRSPRSAWCELHGLRQPSPQRGELQAQAALRRCCERRLQQKTYNSGQQGLQHGAGHLGKLNASFQLTTTVRPKDFSPILELPTLARSKAPIQHLNLTRWSHHSTLASDQCRHNITDLH